VWRSHLVVLVSEGGSTFDAGIDRGLLWRLNRYMEIQGRGGGSVRKRWLISSFVKKVMRGTYWGIGTDIGDYDVPVTGYPRDITKGLIAEIRTDLDAFTVAERLVLENHGYVLAQAAIQRHAGFLAIDPMPPLKVPHPYWMDPANMDRVSHGLRGSSDRSLLGRWR
jgi:NTE family protein